VQPCTAESNARRTLKDACRTAHRSTAAACDASLLLHAASSAAHAGAHAHPAEQGLGREEGVEPDAQVPKLAERRVLAAAAAAAQHTAVQRSAVQRGAAAPSVRRRTDLVRARGGCGGERDGRPLPRTHARDGPLTARRHGNPTAAPISTAAWRIEGLPRAAVEDSHTGYSEYSHRVPRAAVEDSHRVL
jgi:hypothetical protein